MRYGSWSAGFSSAWPFLKAFLQIKSWRRRKRIARVAPPSGTRQSHTLGLICTAITEGQAWKAWKILARKCPIIRSIIRSFIRSYGDICGLPFERVPRRRTDTWSSGNGSASRCGDILLPDRTAWACIFRSPPPWWSPASGVGDGGPPLCWCPYNSSHISDNESGCLTSGHHRRQVLKGQNLILYKKFTGLVCSLDGPSTLSQESNFYSEIQACHFFWQ